MKIPYDEIETAFYLVGSDMRGMNNAYLCMETGEIHYITMLSDSD